MTERTPETKRLAHVTLSARDEKNPGAKPSLSDAEARRLLAAVEGGDWIGEAQDAEDCTYAGCGVKVANLKQLIAAVTGRTVSCNYSCEWFYSTGGGWEHVCYANCQGPGITLEATIS
jgi:hypothetical protein